MVKISRYGDGQTEAVKIGEAIVLLDALRLVQADPMYPKGVYAFEVYGKEFVGWGTTKDITTAAMKAFQVV